MATLAYYHDSTFQRYWSTEDLGDSQVQTLKSRALGGSDQEEKTLDELIRSSKSRRKYTQTIRKFKQIWLGGLHQMLLCRS